LRTPPDLPHEDQLIEVLESLLERRIPFSRSEAAEPPCREGYACLCRDDAGAIVAAFTMDARASMFLGMQMMAVFDEHAAVRALGDTMDGADAELLDAVGEVFNNLTIPLNAVTGNPHTVAGPATPTARLIEDAQGTWLDAPSKRIEIQSGFLGGLGRVGVLIK